MNHRFSIAHKPVIWFYIFAFLLSWLGWVPQLFHARGIIGFDSPVFTFLGVGGPTLAAVLVVWVKYGRRAIPGLFSPLAKAKVDAWSWITALLAWAAITGAALALGALVGIPLPDPEKFGPITGLLPVFIMMLLSNVWEEIGWRGFALPMLQKRWSAIIASLIMAPLWVLWHLPLLLNPQNAMSAFPWWAEIVFTFALTILYTSLYNQSKGSLLMVTIFHAMSNTAAYWLMETSPSFASHYLWTVAVTTFLAVIVVFVCKPETLSRLPKVVDAPFES